MISRQDIKRMYDFIYWASIHLGPGGMNPVLKTCQITDDEWRVTLFNARKLVEANEDPEEAQEATAMATIPAVGHPTLALEQQARERLNVVSPHLLRAVNEVQKLLYWQEFAKSALTGITSSRPELGPTTSAKEAALYADAMMELLLERQKETSNGTAQAQT